MPQQRSEETRAKILNAAQHLFARDGYDTTGVAEICEAAGVSKGAFYHHFESKQAVFVALLDRWLRALDQQMQRVRGESSNTTQGLVDMAALTGSVFKDGEGQLLIFLEFWTKAAHDPQMWRTVPDQFERYRKFIAAMVQDGIAEGDIRPVDAQAVARILLALGIGMLVQGLVSPEEADWGAAVQDGVTMLLDGLRKGDRE